jgi:hypothetical protein
VLQPRGWFRLQYEVSGTRDPVTAVEGRKAGYVKSEGGGFPYRWLSYRPVTN